MTTAQDCIEASKDPDILAAAENVVASWCKQIEQVSKTIPLFRGLHIVVLTIYKLFLFINVL